MKRRPVDSTARISRTQVEAQMRAARAGRFVWPAPPYWEFHEEAPDAENCVIHFKDGAKAGGALVEFTPDDEMLKFRRNESTTPEKIAFSALARVQLLRPARLRRQAVKMDETAQLFGASERQPFSLDLAGGKRMQGETVGSVSAVCGLFLYLPEGERAVLRWFMPADALESSSIGRPLGEMLVEENLASPEAIDAALSKQRAMRARRFGEYLTENQIVSPEQLAAALKQQRAQPVQKLGETLVELGYLSRHALDEALAIEARDRSVPLGRILTEMGAVDAEVLNSVMAKKLGIPFVTLKEFRIPPEVLKRVPAAVAQRFQALPVAEADNALVIALEDPMSTTRMEELRFATGLKLLPVMAAPDDLRAALERAYGSNVVASPGGKAGARDAAKKRVDIAIGELTQRLSVETADADLDDQAGSEVDSTLVKLVNKMILDAIEQKASDLHIEANPAGRDLRVRFRKDGSLVNYLSLPSKFQKAVVSRLKIMAQLDITERRKPQDGKIEFRRFGPTDVDLRVATIPTANGLEDVVMRVLAAATPVALDELGFDERTLAEIKRLMRRPHGLFLVCGPTGSGKTTTLHSLLGFLNTSDLKIWTAEDPIEIAQPGLRQVQVNAKIGWTFAAAMRSFMRADPDVIMVGEMRDAETAKTGIEASLTGHLVLSTLHTNSAVESVARLLDLGMDPFNFADALLGVLAQRLVRRLCPDCRTSYSPSAAEREELGGYGGAMLYRAKGCKRCDDTGYKGRIAVHELLVADASVKRLVQTRAPIAEIATAAAANGLRTLKQDVIGKVVQGLTDMQQVRTV